MPTDALIYIFFYRFWPFGYIHIFVRKPPQRSKKRLFVVRFCCVLLLLKWKSNSRKKANKFYSNIFPSLLTAASLKFFRRLLNCRSVQLILIVYLIYLFVCHRFCYIISFKTFRVWFQAAIESYLCDEMCVLEYRERDNRKNGTWRQYNDSRNIDQGNHSNITITTLVKQKMELHCHSRCI